MSDGHERLDPIPKSPLNFEEIIYINNLEEDEPDNDDEYEPLEGEFIGGLREVMVKTVN